MTDQSQSNKITLGQRILHSVLLRILAGFLVVAGMVIVIQSLLGNAFESSSMNKEFKDLIEGIAVAIVSITCYTVLYQVFEKRKISELSSHRLIRNLSLGLLLGCGLQSLTIAVIYFSGSYEVLAINNFGFLLPSLTMAITSAIFEEILFRGILYRLIEEKLGSYLALAISALIFGGLHLMNPNSSMIAAAGLAIQAGLLLGAVYIFSRNLWLLYKSLRRSNQKIAQFLFLLFSYGIIMGSPLIHTIMCMNPLTYKFGLVNNLDPSILEQFIGDKITGVIIPVSSVIILSHG